MILGRCSGLGVVAGVVTGSFLGLPLWVCSQSWSWVLLSIVGLLSCSWVLVVVHGGGVGFDVGFGGCSRWWGGF